MIVFDEVSAAIEEAQWCADKFDDRYAIVAYLDSFGVCEESEVAKCENVVEVCYSTQLSDQERERINMVKALESIKFFQGKKEDYY